MLRSAILALSLVLTGAYLGRGASTWARVALPLDVSVAAAASSRGSERPPRDPTRILMSGLFPAPRVEPPPPGPVTTTEATPCGPGLRLVGTVVHHGRSVAAVTTATATTLVRIGGRLDEATVVSIDTVRVRLAGPGGSCDLSMFSPRAAGTPPLEVAPPPIPLARLVASPPVDDLGVRQVSPDSWSVPRAAIEVALLGGGELMRTLRVRFPERDGRVVGTQLYGIRRGSPLGLVGLQNGDILRSVNGYALSDPDGMLEALQRLRTAEHLTLSIERRGDARTLQYRID